MKGYTHQNYGKDMARTLGRDLPISTRQSIEICSLIRHSRVQDAINRLTKVTDLEQPVQYLKRASAPHKKGFGAAKYPAKCAQAFIRLLRQVQANAQFKGLNTAHLEIIHVNAQQASRGYHYGRKRRQKVKSTHVEIVVAEQREKKQPKLKAHEQKKPAKTAAPAKKAEQEKARATP